MAHNFRATDIAWAIPVNTAMERYVLLALAAYANDGFTCYPSVSRLSELTKLDAKTVRRALRGLESVGAIEITASPVHGSNIYRIRQKPTPTESGRGVLPDPAGGTTRSGTTRSGRGVLPDPVPKHIKEQIKKQIREQIRKNARELLTLRNLNPKTHRKNERAGNRSRRPKSDSPAASIRLSGATGSHSAARKRR